MRGCSREARVCGGSRAGPSAAAQVQACLRGRRGARQPLRAGGLCQGPEPLTQVGSGVFGGAGQETHAWHRDEWGVGAPVVLASEDTRLCRLDQALAWARGSSVAVKSALTMSVRRLCILRLCPRARPEVALQSVRGRPHTPMRALAQLCFRRRRGRCARARVLTACTADFVRVQGYWQSVRRDRVAPRRLSS